jgi:hypothetical protein
MDIPWYIGLSSAVSASDSLKMDIGIKLWI